MKRTILITNTFCFYGEWELINTTSTDEEIEQFLYSVAADDPDFSLLKDREKIMDNNNVEGIELSDLEYDMIFDIADYYEE